MIRAIFHKNGEVIDGFEISGHSGSAESGSDIVCAAVSSAAYMSVNTVTDVLNIPVKSDIKDGYMKIMLKTKNKEASDIFSGLKLHLTALAEDYPDFIKTTTEV